MPFDRAKHMPQVIGIGVIGVIGGLGISQAQRLSGLLRKIYELVHFLLRHERVHQPAETAMHKGNERGTPWAGHLAKIVA